MKPPEDYYDVLQVSPHAVPEVIEGAYRKLAKKIHDEYMAKQITFEEMNKRLTQLNCAHDVLSDPAKRRDYHQEWLRRQREPTDEPFRQPPPPPPSPANIVLSDFSISPQQIPLGDSITVSVRATNHGGTAGSKTISIRGFILSKAVTLNPGASTTVEFSITPDKIGTFNIAIEHLSGSYVVTGPASVVLTDFSISPQQILLGSSINISVTATNIGNSVGSKTIAMLGDFINSQIVTLNPGASTTVNFTIAPDKIGRFSISLGPFTGSFSVTAPSKPIPVAAKLLTGLVMLSIVVGLGIHFWSTNTPTTKPSEAWAYSKNVAVQEQSGHDLSNYQILLELNSTNFNFSGAKPDGSDLRLFAGSQELSYWIEEWNANAKNAKIWVKVPSIPANSEVTIKMLFGNPAVSSASNGEPTFDFFDDFSGTSLNENKWNIAPGTGGGYVEVKDGIAKIVSPIRGYDYYCCIWCLYSKATFGIDTMFVAKRMKVTTGTDYQGPALFQGFANILLPGGANQVQHNTLFQNESWVDWELYNDGNRYYPHKDLTDTGVSEGSWYSSGVAWYDNNGIREVAWFKNGVRDSRMDYSSNDYVPDTPLSVRMCCSSYPNGGENTGYMAVDYVFLRKFVAQEPSVQVEPTL